MPVARTEFMRGLVAAGKSPRTENGGGRLKRYLEPLEQLAEGGFVGREQARRLGREFAMQIPNGPADAGRRRRRDGVEGDGEDGFGRLLDDIAGGRGLPEGIAVLERRGELEAEFRAVIRDAAPKPFGEREALRLERDFGQREIGLGDDGFDQNKHGKNAMEN